MSLFLASTGLADVRTWNDASGRFSIEAELVDFKDGTVRLRKADGEVISIPVSRLSKSDLAFLKRTTQKDGEESVSWSAMTLEPSRFLKAKGNHLRDNKGKGEIVLLHGVNLGGWLLFEEWMTPMDASGLKDDYSVRETLIKRFGQDTADELIGSYQDTWITEHDLDNIKAIGMNTVRLPFWYRNLQTEDGTWRDKPFKRIDWLIEQAGRRGLYVILDFHGTPGGQSDSHTTGRIRKKEENGIETKFWGSKKNLRRTTEIWKRVAKRYKGNPTVAAYDLINEPIGAPNREALWSVYDRLYKAKYLGWGWDVLPPPSQARWKNMLYQMHSYEWDWNNLEKQKKNIDNVVADWQSHKSWKVPCLIGEFNPMGQEAAWEYAIKQYAANQMSWTTWSYKATHGSGSDSWGLYNPRKPFPPKPNIQTDSAEDIREKWSSWSTEEAFAINPMLERVFNKE